MKNTAIKFEESDYYSIELDKGLFLVDNKLVETEKYSGNKVQVKNINNVIPITRTEVIDHYWSENGMKMSVSCYNSEKDILLKDRVELENNYEWTSLEAEYTYKKFIQTWTPIKKSIEVKGDPYSFVIVESKMDTGNPFISSEYINGGTDPLMFTYNRYSALIHIVSKKFKSLGMEFKGDIDYSATKFKKVWGNSTHSCIRFVTAYNKYIFGKSWENAYSKRGTLKSLLAQYNNDKEILEKIIQDGYNEHFGVIDSEEFDFKNLLEQLRSTASSLREVDPKSKTYDSYRRAVNKLDKSIQFIVDNFKIK